MTVEGRDANGNVTHPILVPGYTYDGEPEPEAKPEPAEDAPKPARKPRAKKADA